MTVLYIIQWEFLYFSVFVNFPYYSIGIEVSGLRRWGGWTYGWMDGRTYVWTCLLCLTGHQPFGAAVQKGLGGQTDGNWRKLPYVESQVIDPSKAAAQKRWD